MTMKMKTVFTALGVFVLLAFLAAPAHAAPPAHAKNPVVLSFEKSQVNGFIWMGSFSGEIDETPVWGTVTAVLDPTWFDTGQVRHVSFEWLVEHDLGYYSFYAEVEGTINLKSGRVVLDGVVAAGFMTGEKVRIVAKLDWGSSDLHSEGTIRIMPSP